MDTDYRVVVIGFVGAAVVLGVMLWFVGINQITAALVRLTVQSLAIIVGLGLAWLVTWSLALHRILDSIGTPTSRWTAFLLFASAAFTDNITPLGQAGGGPFSALLISRRTETSYESGFASITSFDALNLVPSITLAGIGLAYYSIQYAVGRRLTLVMLVVGAMILGIPMVAVTSRRFSTQISSGLTRVLTVVLRRVASVVPIYDPPTQTGIRERVDAYLVSIKRVGTNRTDLAVALGFSTLGWLLLSGLLYVSMQALTATAAVPAFVVLIIVPVSTIASVTPLPGGTGGVELAITLLLLPFGIPEEVALGIALVFRLGSYWLSTLVGGLCVFALEHG